MILQTDHLTKTFGAFTAVGNLNISIPEGSIYGFLGPNGAGKTTTLKMLSGLIRPCSGKIIIDGRIRNFGSPESGRDIGYLPDVPGFYDWMTAPDFLTFSGELLGMRGRELKSSVLNLIELTGLGGVKKRIGAYSRGMKQRLGIAQALIGSPGLLLLDEPTSALDPLGRKDIIDIVSGLKSRATVLFSTHIISDIERVCTHVGIINKGRLVAEDTISGLTGRHSGNKIIISTTAENSRLLQNSISEAVPGAKPEISDRGLIVAAGDAEQSYLSVLRIIFELQIIPSKIEIFKPNLEDVFLKLVKSDD